MHLDLLYARENLRKKLLNNAEIVIEEILKTNLDNLMEIGLFGSLSKDNFMGTSDSDLYLVFDGIIPNRQTKGILRSVAEVNNCDIVYVTKDNLYSNYAGLLEKNILNDRIILWRKQKNDKK
jgi:predicted nucleotidyltransferase